MTSRRDWSSWERYKAIHDRHIRGYLDHFILEDSLIPDITQQIVRWSGTLYCVDGIEIVVKLLQDVRSRGNQPQVRTRRYSYHVLRRVGGRVINLIRYDNAPHFNRSGSHHVHSYDERGYEIRVDPLRDEEWPTLGTIIEQTHSLWQRMGEAGLL